MSAQAALLRAVNVGGTGKVPMAELRALAEGIGLKNPRTLLQSGNLVFEAGSKSPAATRKLLEEACAKRFGLKTGIQIRTATEIAAVVTRNPFAKEARDDPARLHVLFMSDAPEVKAFKTLQAAIKGREIVKGDGRHAYFSYPGGMGESKLTLAVIERHLRTSGTMRNWNTVTKLAAMLAD